MGNKEKNFVSAVIYVRNAENRIDTFLKTIIDVLEENFEYSEIICVNDASDDGSIKQIRETSLAAKFASVSVINMSYYHGLEIAMNAGRDLAIGDFVFEFDNTILDFDAEQIMNTYYHALKGYDIVSASANRKEQFSSRFFYMLFDKFTNLSYEMGTESFRVLSRRVINRISSMNKTVPYRKAVYANSGLKTDNIKYEMKVPANTALDKKEKKYRYGLAVDSLILFTNIGYKFSMVMSVSMIMMTLFVLIYTIIAYAISHPVEGWTSTILFLSIAFFGLFGILTIIIKYLQILVNLVFKRKNYSFESVEKITK